MGLMNLILQNKMIWMVGVFMLMMGGMQKLTSDPELMKELRGEEEKIKPEDILGQFLPKSQS